MRVLLSAICAVVFTSFAAHAQPRVTGETTVKEYKLVRLKAEGVDAKAGISWRVYPKKDVDKASTPEGVLEFTAPPGTYDVTMQVVKLSPEGKTSVEDQDVVVTIQGEVKPEPKPDPGPGPKPNPDPTPGPVTPSKLFLIVVEETQDQVAERGAMFMDKTLAARMKEKGHKWRVVDKDVVGPDGKPPADVARFLQQSAGKGYPQLYLVDADGKTRWSGPCPKKASDILTQITAFGG